MSKQALIHLLFVRADLVEKKYAGWWPGTTGRPKRSWFDDSKLSGEPELRNEIFIECCVPPETSYSWHGYLFTSKDMQIQFELISDDNSALFIKNQLKIDNMGEDGTHGAVMKTSGWVIIRANRKVNIDVYYGQHSGSSYFLLSFQVVVEGEWNSGEWQRDLGRFVVPINPTPYTLPKNIGGRWENSICEDHLWEYDDFHEFNHFREDATCFHGFWGAKNSFLNGKFFTNDPHDSIEGKVRMWAICRFFLNIFGN